jgi:hypothetical protein
MVNGSLSAHDPTDPDFENGTSSPPEDSAVNGVGGEVVNGKKQPPNGGVVNNGLIRRSNRRQKVRGEREREIIVSSDMLLRDLKVKVRRYEITRLSASTVLCTIPLMILYTISCRGWRTIDFAIDFSGNLLTYAVCVRQGSGFTKDLQE